MEKQYRINELWEALDTNSKSYANETWFNKNGEQGSLGITNRTFFIWRMASPENPTDIGIFKLLILRDLFNNLLPMEKRLKSHLDLLNRKAGEVAA